jgi:shikimate kinase
LDTIWFVLGPSGTGKSSFGEYLANNKDWYHLEIDQFDKDGIDIHGLRQDWDAYFCKREPSGLLKELEKRTKDSGKFNCVLTFLGNLVLSTDHISAVADNIKIIYLYGSAARCITAFLKREKETHRNLGLDFWITNNCASYIKMSEPEFEANRVYVWTNNGERRQHEDIFAEISKLRTVTY